MLISGCAVKNQINARKILFNCKYSVEEVAFEHIFFSPKISFDDSEVKLDIDTKKLDKRLISMFKRIKNRDFNLEFSELKFKIDLGIENPEEYGAIMDSLYLDVLVQNEKLFSLQHIEHIVVPARSKKNTKFYLSFPTNISLKDIKKIEELDVKGTVWLRLDLIGQNHVLIPAPINLKIKIPKSKLNTYIQNQKENVARFLIKRITTEIKRTAVDSKNINLDKVNFQDIYK